MFIQDVDRAIADALTRLQASFARETWVIPQSGGKDSRWISVAGFSAGSLILSAAGLTRCSPAGRSS
jgi:hypothetical protein